MCCHSVPDIFHITNPKSVGCLAFIRLHLLTVLETLVIVFLSQQCSKIQAKRRVMNLESLSRRTLLDSVIRLSSLPAGMAFFSGWTRAAQQHQHVSGSAAPSEASDFTNYKPQFFSAEDFEAIQSFTEILIPTDETPGAREAHCAHFIDFVLHAAEGYAPDTQKQWRAAMAALREAGFHSADGRGRQALVAEMAQPERDPSAHHPAFTAYKLIKRENTFAFYTARAGCIAALDYRGNTINLQFPACTHPEHQHV